jgi:hypothetical protein
MRATASSFSRAAAVTNSWRKTAGFIAAGELLSVASAVTATSTVDQHAVQLATPSAAAWRPEVKLFCKRRRP